MRKSRIQRFRIKITFAPISKGFVRYEFELFESVISGNLSPFSECISDPLRFNKAIEEKHSTCFNFIIADFRRNRDKFALLEKKVISSLHPSADNLITPQQNLFQAADIENIAPSALKQLKLKPQNIVSISYSRQPNKTTVYIKETRDCKTIPPNEAKYYYYNDLLKDETLRIKKAMKDNVFVFKNSEDIEHYIHKQQHALINLCFHLMKLIDAKNQNDIYKLVVEFTDADILSLTYIRLEELLCFFEKNYFNYIDENIQIPYRSELVKIYGIKEKLELVKSVLINSQLCPDLFKIIYVPFIKLNAITLEERISYRELIYFNTYLTAFYEEIKQNNHVINEQQVHEILHQVNFNSPELFQYKIAKIQKDIEMLPEDSEKINLLYLTLKIVNQRQSKLNIAFIPDLQPLKQQITGWLEEEINYLNKKILLATSPHQPNLFSQVEKTKIQTGLSVAQLAYFHKLQSEVGIITHKNQRDIFRHIAESYQTSKVHEISPDSIGSKYYNIDSKTQEVLKELVIQMLNTLKSSS